MNPNRHPIPPAHPLPNQPLTIVGQTQTIHAYYQCCQSSGCEHNRNNPEPPTRGSRRGTQQPSRMTEKRHRRARQASAPPLSSPSSPSLSTVSSLESDEDKYWQAFGTLDQELCDLFDKVSFSGPGKETPKAERTRETADPRATPAPHPGGPQFPRSMPPTGLSRQWSTAAPPSPSPNSLSVSSRQLTPHPSPQSNFLGQKTPPVIVLPPSQEYSPKKYYVVTRGRKVGVFTNWLVVKPLVSRINADHVSFRSREAAYAHFEQALKDGLVQILE